jgi:hypothetical protein
MFRELMVDILDDDVAFVNMSIRESKWRQISKNKIKNVERSYTVQKVVRLKKHSNLELECSNFIKLLFPKSEK